MTQSYPLVSKPCNTFCNSNRREPVGPIFLAIRSEAVPDTPLPHQKRDTDFHLGKLPQMAEISHESMKMNRSQFLTASMKKKNKFY